MKAADPVSAQKHLRFPGKALLLFRGGLLSKRMYWVKIISLKFPTVRVFFKQKSKRKKSSTGCKNNPMYFFVMHLLWFCLKVLSPYVVRFLCYFVDSQWWFFCIQMQLFKYYREEACVILMLINVDIGIQTTQTKRGYKEKASFLMTNLYFQVAGRKIVFA